MERFQKIVCHETYKQTYEKLQELEKMMKLTNMLSKVGIDVRRIIFKEVLDGLGGKLRLLVNGAAALSPEVEKGFNDLGITTVQGY